MAEDKDKKNRSRRNEPAEIRHLRGAIRDAPDRREGASSREGQSQQDPRGDVYAQHQKSVFDSVADYLGAKSRDEEDDESVTDEEMARLRRDFIGAMPAEVIEDAARQVYEGESAKAAFGSLGVPGVVGSLISRGAGAVASSGASEGAIEDKMNPEMAEAYREAVQQEFTGLKDEEMGLTGDILTGVGKAAGVINPALGMVGNVASGIYEDVQTRDALDRFNELYGTGATPAPSTGERPQYGNGSPAPTIPIPQSAPSNVFEGMYFENPDEDPFFSNLFS